MKGFVATAAQVMDPFGDQFLAGPAFTGDQHGRVFRPCHPFHFVDNSPHRLSGHDQGCGSVFLDYLLEGIFKLVTVELRFADAVSRMLRADPGNYELQALLRYA